jgi:hypothetical protein
VSALPLARPRRNRWRRLLTHDRRRLMHHYVGCCDFERLWRANIAIGNARWLHVFADVMGDPHYGLPRETAHVIAFPERRSELAKLRDEIEELKRVRGGCC